MRHVYECPTRWADLDVQGHVNNVVYADYLQEARVDMLRVHARSPRTDPLAEGTVVVSHRVDYVAEIRFDHTPVMIECWLTEIRSASFTMAYEIYRESPETGARQVHARARTVLAPYVFAAERPRRITPQERAALEPYLEPEPAERVDYGVHRRLDIGHFPLTVRFSDVDAYRHVNNVKYFEYVQEARLLLMHRLLERAEPGTPRPGIVVARTDVAYRRPILHRPAPYAVWSRIDRVGNTSYVVGADICDPEDATAPPLARSRAVVVCVDSDTGRPTPVVPWLREQLTVLT